MEPESAHAEDANRPDRLLFFTTVSACDGTVAMLAAAGVLTSVSGAIAAGLTVIAGAGAWLAAREAYGGRTLGPQDRRRLAATAAMAALAATIAVLAGTTLDLATLRVVPRAAAAALLLVALEVAGLRLPRLGPLPLPACIIALALAWEVTRVLW